MSKNKRKRGGYGLICPFFGTAGYITYDLKDKSDKDENYKYTEDDITIVGLEINNREMEMKYINYNEIEFLKSIIMNHRN
jgi:hypothetical protein